MLPCSWTLAVVTCKNELQESQPQTYRRDHLQANFSDIPNVLGLHSLIVKSVSLKPSKSLGSDFHIFSHVTKLKTSPSSTRKSHVGDVSEIIEILATQNALARGVRADFFAFTQSCSFQEGKDQKITDKCLVECHND